MITWNMGHTSLYSGHQKTGYVTNDVVKNDLRLQFPQYKNVTKYDV